MKFVGEFKFVWRWLLLDYLVMAAFCWVFQDFDSTYGPAWHCIVGTSFGSYVTHSLGGFIYFSIDKVYVLLFKTAVQPLGQWSISIFLNHSLFFHECCDRGCMHLIKTQNKKKNEMAMILIDVLWCFTEYILAMKVLVHFSLYF